MKNLKAKTTAYPPIKGQNNKLSPLCNTPPLNKYLLLIFLSGLGLLAPLKATNASDLPPTFTAAPINPEFTAWQMKLETSGLEIYDEQGYALGHIPSPLDRSHLKYQKATLPTDKTLPASYDLRSSGYVTSVKDQGYCGSCWTFATYGSLESWLLKNEGETWDFSENHLKNYHGFDWGPCDGGNPDISTAYLAQWQGPVDESDDPYHDWDDRPSPGGPAQKYLKNALWFFSYTDIKNAIMNYGALDADMYWNPVYYNSFNYTYYYNGGSSPNHEITIVGWDDNKPVSGAPGNGAWLIKNSWGTSWGDSGYFWISYYDSQAITYALAFCNAVPNSTYLTNYQYDPLGWTMNVGYGSSIAWAANIFTATAKESLKAVALYAVDNNVAYQIYIYDNFSGSSFSGLLGSTSGTLINSGYQTISLPSAINLTNGDDFSIVVKFTTTGYGYPVPVEADFIGYSSGATANPGESYISSSGSTFTDITSYGGYENTNVCIKGLTVPITDYNKDETVNFPDYQDFADAWGTSFGEPGFNDIYDLSDNNVIDLPDLAIFSDSWLWQL